MVEEPPEHHRQREQIRKDGRPRRTADAHLRAAPFAENHRIVHDDVRDLPCQLGDHQPHVVRPSAEEARQRALREAQRAAEQQDLQIFRLQNPQFLRMTDDFEKPVRPKPEKRRDDTAEQRQIQALPVDGADLAILPRAHLVRRDRARVAHRPDDQAGRQPRQHASRSGRRDRHRRIPRKEHRIRELHQDIAGRRHHQRRGQSQQPVVFRLLTK